MSYEMLKDFFERAFGRDKESMKRQAWVWLKPLWIVLASVMIATWLGNELDKDFQKKIPEWLQWFGCNSRSAMPLGARIALFVRVRSGIRETSPSRRSDTWRGDRASLEPPRPSSACRSVPVDP